MNPNLMTSYMALQVERAGLDRKARRGWLAAEAAARRDRWSPIGALARMVAVVLGRLPRDRDIRPISGAATRSSAEFQFRDPVQARGTVR
jgi:hypothetical protein